MKNQQHEVFTEVDQCHRPKPLWGIIFAWAMAAIVAVPFVIVWIAFEVSKHFAK